MREIKFRAWEKREKRMIYAEEAKDSKTILAVGFHGLPIAVDSGSFRDDEIIGWNIDHRLELMQCTGLKDCKGKDIYEGDILGLDDPEDDECRFKWIVEYGYSGFRVVPIGDTGNVAFRSRLWDDFIVIGNIYEHSTLLVTT